MDVHNLEQPGRWGGRLARWRGLPGQFGPWWWWMWLNMQLSDWPRVGPFFTWLAGLPLPPYRKKWPLARITSKPYLSPKAQNACADLHLGPGCFIDDFVTFYSSASGGSIRLDRNVYLHRGTIIEAGQGGRVIIGEGTHVQANCMLNAFLADVRIGREVMLAPQCGLFSYQHSAADLSRPMTQQGLTSKGDLVIEDDVWVGFGATLMDGVRIGRGAVIGAGAVVTQDIPPLGIAAGVPARVIGQRGAADRKESSHHEDLA